MTAVINEKKLVDIIEALRECSENVNRAFEDGSLTASDVVDYLLDESWLDSVGSVSATHSERDRGLADAEGWTNEHVRWLDRAPVVEIANWVDLNVLMARCDDV